MADSLKIRIDGDTKGLENSLSGIGSIAKKGLGVAVKGIAATGAAIAGISGLAINAYKDYEQLVGGVDTLFKDSSQKVQEYAANAYRTAGVSANQYMETVTSFSASLLQSLKGDTQAAADMSDMALTDMSDNANKMGSNMETIIATYQSLSRGNFAMLDNLKLGYGGTRAELERLVKDAAKLDKSVKANDTSFSNIVKAIHAVQTEMGITGTTAKEASTTIEGSVNMMKAAWENLMVGVADDNADFDKLLDDFVDSVLTVGDNLLPRIQTTVKGIGKFISKASEDIVPELIDIILDTLPLLTDAAQDVVLALATGIEKNSGKIAESAVIISKTLVDGLLDIAPSIVDMAGSIISEFASKIGEMIPLLSPVTSIISLLADNLNSLIPALLTGVVALKGWQIATTISGVISSLTSAWKAAKDAVVMYTAAQTAYNAGAVLTTAGTKALTSGLTVGQVAVGALTKKIGWATAAQSLWNATVVAHPIGAAVVAVAALTAGIIALYNWMNKETEAEKAHREAVEASAEATRERTEALREERNALSEEVSASQASYDNVKLLTDELIRLADSTGKVTDADRGRASFILGELNNALGTEYALTGNQITRYNELKNSIYGLIEAKKAEAYLNAYKDDYENALKEQKQAQEELTKNKLLYNATLIKENELTQQLAEKELARAAAQERLKQDGLSQEYIHETNQYISQLSNEISNYEGELRELQSINAEGKRLISETENSLSSYTKTIGAYETATEQIANGNTAGAIKTMEDFALKVGASEIAAQEFAAGSKEALGQVGAEYQNAVTGLINALKAYETAPSNSTSAMVSNALTTLQSAESSYIAAGGTLKNGVITGWDGQKFGVDSDMSLIIGELTSYEGVLKQQGSSLGISYTDGYLNSLVDGVDGVKEAAENIGDGSIEGLKTSIASNSPSKMTEDLGNDYGQGYINGIDAKQEEIYQAGYNLGLQALQGTQDGTGNNPSIYGEIFTTDYAGGVTSQAGAVNSAGLGVANSGLIGLQSVNTLSTGQSFISPFTSGIASQAGAVNSASSGVANRGKAGLESVKTSSSGSLFVNTFTGGITSMVGAVSSAGVSIASRGKAALETVKANSSGNNFTIGFANGILGSVATVVANAVTVGKRALAALKGAIQEGSPSKITRKSGGFFTQGFALGISDDKEKAVKATVGMVNDTIEAAKKTAKIHSPSQRARDEIGKMLPAGVVVGINDGKSEVEKAMEEVVEIAAQTGFEQALSFAENGETIWKIKQQEVKGLLALEKEYAAESARIEKERADKEYQDRLKNAKDSKEKEKIKQERINEEQEKAQDAYLENLKIAADKERKIYEALQKDIENAQKKAVDAFTEMASKAIDNIEDLENAQNDFASKLKDSTSLFYTYSLPTLEINGESVTPTFAGLSDLSRQTEKLEQYADNLDKLKARGGVPEEILNQIRELSVDEGMMYTDALLKASDKEFNKYIDDYNRQQKAIERISKNEFATLEQELKEQFGAIPTDFWGVGEESAKNFTDAFIKSFEKTWKSVKEVVFDTLSTLSPQMALNIESGGGSVVNNTNTYSPVFYVKSSGNESVQQQLRDIRNADYFNQLRRK